MHAEKPRDESLNQAILFNRDYAGLVTFNDLAYAVQLGRYEILSIHRRSYAIGNDPNYEVVLRVKRYL